MKIESRTDIKTLFGIMLVIGSICFGLYVGGYLCFIGGITQALDAIQTTPIPSNEVAWGVAKIVSSPIAGFSAAVVAFLVGKAVLL